MPLFWQELIKYLGGMAIASAALAWLAKQIIVHFLSKDVEAYKVRLKAESDKEIESLKSKLQLLNQQQVIRYSKLHEKRAEIIWQLYQFLDDAVITGETIKGEYEFSHSLEIEDLDIPDLRERLANTALKLHKIFVENRLFFDKELCQNIELIVKRLNECSVIHVSVAIIPASNPIMRDYLQKLDVLVTEIRTSQNTLEAEFRKLIGSEE